MGWERFRASQFGIRHYCTIGLNSKEANNEALAEAVLDILPRYLSKEGVVAVGEIGYDDGSAIEDKYYRAQLQLSREFDMLVMVHTPHRDKKAGTIRSMQVAGVLVFALNLLRRRARGDMPRAVVTLIACMSVLDGVVLAGGGRLLPAMLAVAAFGLTLALQRSSGYAGTSGRQRDSVTTTHRFRGPLFGE